MTNTQPGAEKTARALPSETPLPSLSSLSWCCQLTASLKHMDPSAPSHTPRHHVGRRFKEHSSTELVS